MRHFELVSQSGQAVATARYGSDRVPSLVFINKMIVIDHGPALPPAPLTQEVIDTWEKAGMKEAAIVGSYLPKYQKALLDMTEGWVHEAIASLPAVLPEGLDPEPLSRMVEEVTQSLKNIIVVYIDAQDQLMYLDLTNDRVWGAYRITSPLFGRGRRRRETKS